MPEMILTSRAEKVEPRSLVAIPMRDVVRTLHSPSPRPSPQRRGRIVGSLLANRKWCELSRGRQSGSSLLLSRASSVGAHRKEPQRREDHREASGRERAQTDHLSVTDSRVRETGPSLRSSRLCGLTGFPSTGWVRSREKAGVRGSRPYSNPRRQMPTRIGQF